MTEKKVTPKPSEPYPVHPCADIFPMMTDAELDALAKDIKANGLRELPTVWVAPQPSKKRFLLDGRNRLEAMRRLGRTLPLNSYQFIEGSRIEPAVFVIGKNIHRRHLSKAQQAELIIKAIEAGKNEKLKVSRSFSPTEGKRGGSTKDPVLTEAVAVAKQHGISKGTVKNARAKLQGKSPAKRRPRLSAIDRIVNAELSDEELKDLGALRPVAPTDRVMEALLQNLRIMEVTHGHAPLLDALRRLTTNPDGAWYCDPYAAMAARAATEAVQ